MDRIDAQLRGLESKMIADINERFAAIRAAYESGRTPDIEATVEKETRDTLMHWYLIIGIAFAGLYGIRLVLRHRKMLARHARASAAASATLIAATTGELLSRGEIDSAFSPARAELIGITETTKAFSEMGEEIAEIFGLKHRFDTWWTSHDEKVCKVCGPLHNAPRRVWSRQFPRGTPAHPRCRCRIKYWRLRG